MTAEQLERQQRVARQYQKLYDDTLRRVGMRAPEPTLGQSINDYRRETLRLMKKSFLQNHKLYDVNMRGLRGDALPVFETQVLAAVPAERFNPMNVPKGQIEEVKELDEYGATRMTYFIGQDSFVKDMMPPSRRVKAFCKSVEPVQEYSPRAGWVPTVLHQDRLRG
jgi:hypothetical protein